MRIKCIILLLIACLLISSTACTKTQTNIKGSSSSTAIPNYITSHVSTVMLKQSTPIEVSYFKDKNYEVQFSKIFGNIILFAYFKQKEVTKLYFGTFNINTRVFNELSTKFQNSKTDTLSVSYIGECKDYYYLAYASNQSSEDLIRFNKNFTNSYSFNLPTTDNTSISYDGNYLLYKKFSDVISSVYLYNIKLKSAKSIYDFKNVKDSSGVIRCLSNVNFIDDNNDIMVSNSYDGGGSDQSSIININGKVINKKVPTYRALPLEIFNTHKLDLIYDIWQTDAYLGEFGLYNLKENAIEPIIKENSNYNYVITNYNSSNILFAQSDIKLNKVSLKYYDIDKKTISTIFDKVGNSDNAYDAYCTDFYLSKDSQSLYYLVNTSFTSNEVPYIFIKSIK